MNQVTNSVAAREITATTRDAIASLLERLHFGCFCLEDSIDVSLSDERDSILKGNNVMIHSH